MEWGNTHFASSFKILRLSAITARALARLLRTASIFLGERDFPPRDWNSVMLILSFFFAIEMFNLTLSCLCWQELNYYNLTLQRVNEESC